MLLFASKGEMRKLVQDGGVSLNKEKPLRATRWLRQPTLLDEKIPAGTARQEELPSDYRQIAVA